MKTSRADSAAIFSEVWCVTLCYPTAQNTTCLWGVSLCILGQRREMVMKEDVYYKTTQERTSFVFI